MTFDEYVALRLGSLLRFAMVVTCEPDLAEDVVQEALVRAHDRWSRIASVEHPEAYVKRMVVNEYLSWRRRRPRVVPVTAGVLAAVAAPFPDHAVRLS